MLEPIMIPIQCGTFQMGSDDGEAPVHSVTVFDFEMGVTPITIEQYLIFCDETKGNYPAWLEMGNNYHIETGTDEYFKRTGMRRENKNHPITGVNWNNAVAYCQWLSKKTGKNYRLPTEAEWEYAARGGVNWKDGFIYAGSNNIDEVAWYSSNSNSQDRSVASKKANQCGLYDMSGNVWEWCHDWYDAGYYDKSPGENPQGPDEGQYRVLRGGSWVNNPEHCRAADRCGNYPDDRCYYVGFRVARDY